MADQMFREYLPGARREIHHCQEADGHLFGQVQRVLVAAGQRPDTLERRAELALLPQDDRHEMRPLEISD
jgi:hypothetical protein